MKQTEDNDKREKRCEYACYGRVEELGISPIPWKACAPTKREVSVVCLKNDKWHSVQAVALCRSDRRHADARLIAAAPKMYEAGNAAYDALEGLCPWYGKCSRCLHGYRIAKDGEWLDPNTFYCNKAIRKDCMVYIALSKLRAALAEARGEVFNG